MEFHKSYYRRFDSMCDKLSKEITDYNATDKQFLSFIQEQRNACLFKRDVEFQHLIDNNKEKYSVDVGVRKCRQKCTEYTRTNKVVYLYEALNYLMLEYISGYSCMLPLDEEDVLCLFYGAVWSESDSLLQAINSFLTVYENFRELGYLELAVLAIRDELYKCKQLGYTMEVSA